jgi:oligopeptide transport system substrate-binding protein
VEYLSEKEAKVKKINVILALSILMVGLFSVAATAEYKGELRIGNGAEPSSIDPHLMQGVLEHRIHMTLFENLTSIKPEDATAIPGVAESWEVSPDGKIYTFKLRKTVWSDGVPVTAETFVKSWLRVLKPSIKAPYGWFPAMFIAGARDYNEGKTGSDKVKVKAIDDYTLQVELEGAFPFFLTSLAHPSFSPVPLHIIEKYGLDWAKKGRMVSNGPFLLEEWKQNEIITCVPNPQYWDKEAVKLSRVIFYPIEDNAFAYKKFLKGELDWIDSIPLDQVETALTRPDSYNAAYLGTYYYIFNCQRKPFSDPKVRKALSISINRQDLTKKITKAGEIASTAFVPPIPGYKTIMGNKEDVELGKKILAEAGFPGGKNFPKFKIFYNKNEAHTKIAEYIQQQWKENLGIECKLAEVEWKSYLAMRHDNNFDVARVGWIGDYLDPNTFLDMFVTDGGLNDGRYSNSEYDSLIRDAAKESDLKKRMELFTQAEEILITQDQAVMPIYYYTIKGMIDTQKWGGWYPNIMNLHPTKNIFLK